MLSTHPESKPGDSRHSPYPQDHGAFCIQQEYNQCSLLGFCIESKTGHHTLKSDAEQRIVPGMGPLSFPVTVHVERVSLVLTV